MRFKFGWNVCVGCAMGVGVLGCMSLQVPSATDSKDGARSAQAVLDRGSDGALLGVGNGNLNTNGVVNGNGNINVNGTGNGNLNVNGSANSNGNTNGNANVNGGGALGACCFDAGSCQLLTLGECGSTVGRIGDLDCNSTVSVTDVSPFVMALTKPSEYATAFPNCDIANADVNGDGRVTVSDIGDFVRVVLQAGPAAWRGAGSTCDDCSGNGNGNGNSNGNANGNVNGNANANVNGNANVNLNGNANVNGNSNGNANGNVNGNVNGNANGNVNGNVNGNANGNVNGNANDNANVNGNANLNGNVNGNMNGNSNVNGTGGLCGDGSTRTRADFAFESRAEHRLGPTCSRFRARTQDWPQSNTVINVAINDVVVGQIFVDEDGRGELEIEPLPGNFPVVQPGDVVSFNGTTGVFQNDCSSGCS